jgi:hypothetical protein
MALELSPQPRIGANHFLREGEIQMKPTEFQGQEGDTGEAGIHGLKMGKGKGVKLEVSSKRAVGAGAVGASAVGTVAIGSFAVGALAVGALAIGALAVGRLLVRQLSVRRSHFGKLVIDELEVNRLRVNELEVRETLQTPSSKNNDA